MRWDALDTIPKEHRPTAAVLLMIAIGAIVIGGTQFFLDPGNVRVSLVDGSSGSFECRTVYSAWREGTGPDSVSGAATPSQRLALEAGLAQWGSKCDDRRGQKVALGGGLIVLGLAIAGGGVWFLGDLASKASPLPSSQRPPPGWWWDGHKWNPPGS